MFFFIEFQKSEEWSKHVPIDPQLALYKQELIKHVTGQDDLATTSKVKVYYYSTYYITHTI